MRLKSGAWDESGVFVFNTLSHIKYCLVNGDSGIVRTLEVPVYLTKVQGDIVQCLDRDGKSKTILVDSTEFMFKAALHRRDLTAVKRIVLSSRISGHAIIGYLQRKGYGYSVGPARGSVDGLIFVWMVLDSPKLPFTSSRTSVRALTWR